MGIDISSLSPWAQKQIAQKIARQVVSRADSAAQEKAEKRGKYHNTPSERIGPGGSKLHFDSKAEARRFDELMLMLKAGEIRDLKLQRQYTLQEAYTTLEGERVRAIRYVADFTYYSLREGREIIEDVKGGSVTQTSLYNVKKKLMQEKYGITIEEVT